MELCKELTEGTAYFNWELSVKTDLQEQEFFFHHQIQFSCDAHLMSCRVDIRGLFPLR
jgi:hypothetical protein